MAEPRDERDASERLERYLDALLAGDRPSPDDVADRDEAEMARLAAELAASAPIAEARNPDPAFVDQLRLRMRAADEGIEAVRVPPPVRATATAPTPAGHTRWRLTRRDLLRAGLGAAAGLAAGGLGVALLPDERTEEPTWDDRTLVGGDGFWQQVATLDELPPGGAIRFSTAAFDGYVVNDGGEVRALSSTCTHLGCTLHYRPDWPDLRCPCHGASFDLRGELANGPSAWRRAGGYRGDAQAYGRQLPPLVRPRVRIDGDRVLVWTAQV
jgi:nitrite reductase/ring-hydroxylating ferredoxin subunit